MGVINLSDFHRLHILVTQKQFQWLQKRRFTTGKSMGAIIRDLINEVIKGGEGGNGSKAKQAERY